MVRAGVLLISIFVGGTI